MSNDNTLDMARIRAIFGSNTTAFETWKAEQYEQYETIRVKHTTSETDAPQRRWGKTRSPLSMATEDGCDHRPSCLQEGACDCADGEVVEPKPLGPLNKCITNLQQKYFEQIDFAKAELAIAAEQIERNQQYRFMAKTCNFNSRCLDGKTEESEALRVGLAVHKLLERAMTLPRPSEPTGGRGSAYLDFPKLNSFLHDEQNIFRRNKAMWITVDGRVVPIHLMTDSHIRNIIRMAASGSGDSMLDARAHAMPTIYAEATERGFLNDEGREIMMIDTLGPPPPESMRKYACKKPASAEPTSEATYTGYARTALARPGTPTTTPAPRSTDHINHVRNVLDKADRDAGREPATRLRSELGEHVYTIVDCVFHDIPAHDRPWLEFTLEREDGTQRRWGAFDGSFNLLCMYRVRTPDSQTAGHVRARVHLHGGYKKVDWSAP